MHTPEALSFRRTAGATGNGRFAECPPLPPYCWGGRPPTASMCQNEVVRSQAREPPMNDIIRIGMDTSKSVFQLHGVNSAEQPALRKRLRRRQVMGFFEKLPATRIGIEACGGS